MARRPPKKVSRTVVAPPARVGVRAGMAITVTGQRVVVPDTTTALYPGTDLYPATDLYPED